MGYPIVKYLPLQPHCFAYGGFDIQMLQTSDAIRGCGINISELDIWGRDADFDILHCWGLGFSHYENYFWAKKSGKKLVATLLMHDIESVLASLKFKVSALISKQRIIIGMLKPVDKIAVVNENQAEICNTYYKVPANKIHIIPNVVNENYFDAALRLDKQTEGQGYVLTTGNICQRKNQVSLAEACIQQNIKLVIVGKVMQGEEIYGNDLAQLVDKNKQLIIWIPGLTENGNELISCYENCKLFALPSFVEQQPISALEAAVLQKPILLADKKYAKQKFYQNACLVNPGSVESIANGLLDVIKQTKNYIPLAVPLQACKKQNVGLAYKALYEEIFN